MAATRTSVFRFADVQVREREFAVIRGGVAQSVEPKAFRVLLILLRNSEKLVSKEELFKAVWGDAAVTDNSLTRSIALLRRLLGDESRNPRYIETVATVGYRFICKVNVCEDPAGALDEASEPSSRIDDVTRSNGSLGTAVESSPRASGAGTVTAGRKGIRATAGAIGMIALLAPAYLVVRQLVWTKVPTVVNIVRLTNDQKPKIPINGVVTDGVHLYFMEGTPEGGGSGIAQVLAAGGETTWITTTLKEPRAITDISPDHSKLLLDCQDGFWVQPLPAGTPYRLGNFKGRGTRWTPDGAHVIYSHEHKIWIANEDGSEPHAVAELPGEPLWFRFSPDGRVVRFSVLRAQGNASSLWEMHPDGTDVHQLLPNWKGSSNQCCGRWSPDGSSFYFLSSGFFISTGDPDIWVMSERRTPFGRDPSPVRLTTGPLRFGAPTPSLDGKSLFTIGDDTHVELFSYDPQTQRFDPYLRGLSASGVAFSPAGGWIAYVSYPDMTLWKSRLDLSERVKLTLPPVRAFGPRWSPDGSKIAFTDVRSDRPSKAVLLSVTEGGSPNQIGQSKIDDADSDPMWAPDGNSIIFARGSAGSDQKRAIYRANLNSGNLTQIPGSDGLYSPRLSPDGRYISALAFGDQKVLLYDQTANTWSTLAEAEHFGFNEWSRDGQYVYVLESGGGRGFARIVRVRVADRVQEEVLSLKDFPQLVDAYAQWYGLTPDGKLLLMRDHSVQEIYALDLTKK